MLYPMPSDNLFSSLSMLSLIPLFMGFPTMVIGASVMLDNANVTGIDTGSVSKFLGIPFAYAPRFDLPIPIHNYREAINATEYGPACIPQAIELPFFPPPDSPTSEECLSINVIKSSNASPGPETGLPVVVWIYGGGFVVGSSNNADDLGTRIVQKSAASGAPVIFVSMNYRLSAYGFLAGSEVQNERIGNFGLWDQHVALKWVQTYIGAFGGDETRVTLWGQSAGAISASLHLLSFGGDTGHQLFHGAFMQSGAPIPVDSMLNGQAVYDQLVANTNCTNAPNTLECLKDVPIDTLKKAVNKSPSIASRHALHLAWPPRADGTFLQEAPMKQILAGNVRNVPIVSGTCDDEGTAFSVSPAFWLPPALRTETDFRNWITNIWVPNATESELAPLWSHYPSDLAAGSPFDTGDANQFLYRQYKRVSAFQGDIVFEGPRRFFLQHVSGKQKTWSYLSKRLKTTGGGKGKKYLGSFHGSDLIVNLTDTYAINFINTLDPNGDSGSGEWPEYTTDSPNLLTFLDDTPEPVVTQDEYRLEQMNYLSALSLKYPL